MFSGRKRHTEHGASARHLADTGTQDVGVHDAPAGVGLWRWALGITAVCAFPLVLLLVGFDLSSECPVLSPDLAGRLTTAQLNDSMHRALCGSFTHTLLEWTAVCSAFFVCMLALVQYRMTREPSLAVIGIALVCAGAMDAFHTLAADRLIRSVADNRDLIPFTWAICRMFNALILLIGVGIFAFTTKKRMGERAMGLVGGASVVFIIAAYLVVHLCATSHTLPNTMFPDSLFKRPYDMVPLVPYMLCALVVFPRYLRRHRTWFASSLLLSLIPHVSAQLYMAFGSYQLHDWAFNVAHALKACAYGVPMIGLATEYIRTHQQRAQATADLRHAHDELEVRVRRRTAEVEQTNQWLAESEARTRAIVETAAEGIISIDEKGVIESFNAAASTIFGYQPVEVIGQNISALMPAPHDQLHDEYIARYLRTGQSEAMGVYRELEARRKDGAIFPADIAISEVQLGARRTFTGIVRDLTERKKLQAQLTQAHKMESIGQLAAGIAHEINTPTQYIGDNTRFLRDAFADLSTFLERYDELIQATEINAVTSQLLANAEATLREVDPEYLKMEIPIAIQQSLEGVEQISKIVRAMKEFSHLGGEQKTLVDLNQAIENTIAVAASEWRRVAEMVTDFDSQLPMVECAPGDINQVILHLVVNAAHAIADVVDDSRKKGTITVSTCRSGDCVEIRVGDSGAGIPVNAQPRVFDPFYTTKEVGKGTGQGLHICYTIVVDKHGGTIEFETATDRGTDFVVRLPIGREQEEIGTRHDEEANSVC